MSLSKKIFTIIIVSLILFMIPATVNSMGNKPVDNPKETIEAKPPVDNPEVGTIDFQNISNLTVEIETCQVLREKLEIYRETTKELATQVSLARQEAAAYKDKFETANKQIESNEKLYKEKEDALKTELKEASKPRWKAMFASAGAGSILTLVLILAAGL
jgi:biopolymer transport protein ExbD